VATSPRTLSLIRHLASRPGHHEVKADFRDLLVEEFGAELGDIQFERFIEVRSRTDALIGRTVFEAKKNLDAERKDVLRKMPEYLANREAETGEKFVGIASDGLVWTLYALDNDSLLELKSFRCDPEQPHAFLSFLDGALALKSSLPPDPQTIRDELGAQFPIAPLRVVYAKAGSLPAACVVHDATMVLDHMLYWAAPPSGAEASYLMAILNNETTRSRVANLQARGQFGARHFDKLMFTLPIPRFDTKNELHAALAMASAKAEKIAAAVSLPEGVRFQRARRLIREALAEAGVSQEIDRLVAQLLDGAPKKRTPDARRP